MIIVVNDIDGTTFHTVSHGDPDAVLAEYPPGHPVRLLIAECVATGETQQATHEVDGEEYTTRVSVATI